MNARRRLMRGTEKKNLGSQDVCLEILEWQEKSADGGFWVVSHIWVDWKRGVNPRHGIALGVTTTG